MTKQDVTVELFIDGAWQTVPVYNRDGIRITHGRSDADSGGQYARAEFTINNRSAAYHPRNAESPLYGKLGRNTPLRVRLGASDIRFAGELTPGQPGRALNGRDVWIAATAAGVTRRLGQGSSPAISAMRRAVTLGGDALAYWPCEDAAGASVFASGLAGGPTMAIAGAAQLAEFDGFASSTPLPFVNSSRWTASMPAGAVGDRQIRFLVRIPAAGETNGVRLLDVDTGGASKPDLQLIRVDYATANGGEIHLKGFDDAGSLFDVTAGTGVNGLLCLVVVDLDRTGAATFTATGTVLRAGAASSSASSGSIGRGFDGIVGLVISPGASLGAATVVGHLSVHSALTATANLQGPLEAFAGETAGTRISRLCGEEGITFTSTGTLADSAPLGSQHNDKLPDLLREAEAADLGALVDKLDAVGLHYRTRRSLYNQAPALTLTFGSNVATPLEPDLDDATVRNDVTVTRRDGSSARAVLTSGRLSTQPPPAGVGTYDDQVTVNVAGDGKILEDQAGWRLHLGTVDEDRWPRLTVNVGKHPELAAAVNALRVGDRIAVNGLPDDLSNNPLSLIVEGWTEVLEVFGRMVTFNCSPESPQRVCVYQSAAGSTVHKYDSDGSTLASGIGPTDTTLSIAIATARPLWTTDAAEDGFDIGIGGERITVGTISGGSSPQTFASCTRSVNGVVKSHSAGAEVRLWQTPVYAL